MQLVAYGAQDVYLTGRDNKELVENIKILKFDAELIKNIKIYKTDNCVICLDAASTCIFIPCGHQCTCSECCEHVGETCPLCRKNIDKRVEHDI